MLRNLIFKSHKLLYVRRPNSGGFFFPKTQEQTMKIILLDAQAAKWI